MHNAIFIQYTPKSQNFLDESFLDLDFAFDLNEQVLRSVNYDFDQNHQRDFTFQPVDFLSDSNELARNFITESNAQQTDHSMSNESQNIRQIENKLNTIAKSRKTKNICFNICQKTVKVLKTRLYSKKLQQICKQFNQDTQELISSVLKIKNDLTGPKALQMFVDQDDSVSKSFKKFMKWFLQEKYLRHAINEGSMDDLKGYLTFKNQVIMNILD